MPSALETLVKILKLEQDTGCQNKAVIGGLQVFAARWAADAHAQARKPEHHTLVDELVGLMQAYVDLSSPSERHNAIKHMLGRITGRIQASTLNTVSAPEPLPAAPPISPPPAAAETRERREKPTREQEPREPERRAENPELREVHRPQERKQPAPRATRRPREDEVDPAVSVVSDDSSEESEQAAVAAEAMWKNGDDFAPVDVVPPPPEPRLTHPPRRKRGPRDPQADSAAWHALNVPVTEMSGIGPRIAEKLAQLGVRTIEQWLYFFPRRYDDYSKMLPLNRLRPNMTITVVGTIRNVALVKGRRGLDVLNVTIDDGTGTLTASFFNQPYLRAKFERGLHVVFSGKTSSYQGRVTMNNPEWELMEREALHTRAIVPVYPLTKGLSAHAMRKLSRRVIERWADEIPDFMPESVLERVDLADLGWAVRQIHFPESDDALYHARRRLTFDELILLQLGVLRNRREWQAQPGVPLHISDELLAALIDALPYSLTGAQARAIQTIREDMARPVPMNRLLQGDVGAGKTVVAAVTMAIAVTSGYQAAIMAPTGILAEQHYKSISKLIRLMPGGDRVNIALLTGSTPSQERSDTLWGLSEGSVHVVVGTHALIEDDVNFARLGVAVIDEQHRFGVEQRGRLRGKGQNPHVLVMTATPIPRTLALTVYADLDLTVLDEMPPGRTPVETRVLSPKERERAYSFIDSQIRKGRQAFIVYPLVEASESDALAEVKSAVEEFERLQNDVFPDRRLGLLHGRLTPVQKDAVMTAFSRAELDILISTSVVEVGIDVPNASVILIEGANRFGLAQLHQFRGRVGRGEHPSFCLLVPDDSEMNNVRLQVMEATTDGFKLAEMDWELRGAGDLLGTRQSGRQASLGKYMDARLVQEAQIEARTLYEEDPELARPEHAALRQRLEIKFALDETADVS